MSSRTTMFTVAITRGRGKDSILTTPPLIFLTMEASIHRILQFNLIPISTRTLNQEESRVRKKLAKSAGKCRHIPTNFELRLTRDRKRKVGCDQQQPCQNCIGQYQDLFLICPLTALYYCFYVLSSFCGHFHLSTYYFCVTKAKCSSPHVSSVFALAYVHT
jgi:hypothetical protein